MDAPPSAGDEAWVNEVWVNEVWIDEARKDPAASAQRPQVPTTSVPSDPSPPAGSLYPLPPVDGQPRWRRWLARLRWRTVLGVGAAIAVMLCGGLGAAGYVWYDRATGPDLTAPDVVVDAYLREELVNRNDVRAAQYLCDHADVTAISAYRSGIVRKEQQLGVTIGVSWGALDVQTEGTDAATVDVTVKRSATVAGIRQGFADAWSFQLINASGWRVCSARRVG